MKRIMLSITLAIIAVSFVLAATLTVNIPANDVPRVSEAYGAMLGLPSPGANMQQVSSRVQEEIINNTKSYERTKYTPPPLEMQPTPTPTATATATPTGTPSATPTASVGLKKK